MQTDTRRIQPGWRVIDRDGAEVGTVDAVGTGYVLVQKGLIFTRDTYIPTEEITRIDSESGHAHIDVTESEIDGLGWDQPPVVTGTEELEDGGYAGGYDSGNVLAGSASASTGAGGTLSDGSPGVRREGYGDEDTLEGDERLR